MEPGTLAGWAGVLVTVGFGAFGVVKWLTNRMAAVEESCTAKLHTLETKHNAEVNALHARINDLKDLVKDNYVRRDDLQKQIDRIERSQEQVIGAVRDLSHLVTEKVVGLARAIHESSSGR